MVVVTHLRLWRRAPATRDITDSQLGRFLDLSYLHSMRIFTLFAALFLLYHEG